VFLSILFTSVGDKSDLIAKGLKAAIMKNPALLAEPRNAVFKNPAELGTLINTDSSFLKKVSPELAAPIQDAFAQSAVLVFQIAAGVVAVAWVLTWFLKEIALRTKSGMQDIDPYMKASGKSLIKQQLRQSIGLINEGIYNCTNR
jgi:hypothetical protein